MASAVRGQSGAGINIEGTSSGRQSQSGESSTVQRSSEQVQNETPSTSPPYWDSDDEEDGGSRPCDLYGKYTWKIDKFSQIKEKELKSDHFEAGGYKWYILIYPQGCDAYNHLSLFLCVADHEKLPPGWGHHAQFTITLVNKDPSKSKYSDTLHRFWKKEHDWGWKKYTELSKVLDEFVVDDTLVIKAQVQVIRERHDRPFRCLAYEYRRELLRLYLTNVEQIFRRYVEERRGKIWKLMEDKVRWSSLHSFWVGMDPSAKYIMSRTKIDAILKVVVKHFFIDKEVNSTIVMDSLYTGMKSLEDQSPATKGKPKHLGPEDRFHPIIHVEEDVFVLVDDVLPLLKRAGIESLPPKYERGPQSRIKDVSAGEDCSEDYSEWDERRLTHFGRRAIEIFVLTHIFSKFEVAYQEALSLKMQEELIQEEAALNEQKGKRGGADKEKKSKKKGKQKRNNRKGKDKGRDDKSSHNSQGKDDRDSDGVERKDVSSPQKTETSLEKPEAVEDLSDASDPEILPPDSEVGGVQNGAEEVRNSSAMGDNSSTCSSDSFTAVVVRRPQNGKKERNHPISRGKKHRNAAGSDSVGWLNGESNKSFRSSRDARNQSETSRSSPAVDSLSKDRIVPGAERHALKKNEKPASVPKEATNKKASPSPETLSVFPRKSESKASSNGPKQVDRHSSEPYPVQTKLRPDNENPATQAPTEKSVEHQLHIERPPIQRLPISTEKPSMSSMPFLSRPLSAPIPSEPRPVAASTAPFLPTPPVLSRSASFAGRFGPEATGSRAAQSSSSSFVPQSYRNAMMGGPNTATPTTSSYTQNHHLIAGGSVVNPSLSYAQATSIASSPMMHPHNSDRIIDPANQMNMNPSFPFGAVNHHQRDVMQSRPSWREPARRDSGIRNLHVDLESPSQSFDVYNNPLLTRSQDSNRPNSESLAVLHNHVEDFPYLDIINDLLDDDYGIERLSVSGSNSSNGLHYMDRQYGSPGGEVSSGPGLERNNWHGYGASRSMYEVGPRRHGDGHSGGFPAPNHRHSTVSDAVPYNQMNNADSNSYSSFRTTEYQHRSADANGYSTVFRP